MTMTRKILLSAEARQTDDDTEFGVARRNIECNGIVVVTERRREKLRDVLDGEATTLSTKKRGFLLSFLLSLLLCSLENQDEWRERQ